MRSILFLVAVAACGLAACGGDDTGSGSGGGGAGGGGSGVECGEHPLQCPAGETCWFTSSTSFTCQASGAAEAGDTCAPLVGQATCSDGLLCVKASASGGVCTPLCDPTVSDATCGDLLCVLVQTEDGAETHVCQ